MAKAGTVKSNVQFIRTPVATIWPYCRAIEYDRLVSLAGEAQEDAAASR